VRFPRSTSGICGLGLAATFVLTVPGRADQGYSVSGEDRYAIGGSDLRTTIAYSGTQRLKVKRNGQGTEFLAEVTYFKVEADGRVPGHAVFAQLLKPSGELEDRSDSDPNYLTVLNQPFTIVLDAGTLNDLRHLDGRLPFEFPAPMAGGTLKGFLQRGKIGRVATKSAISVNFSASGPMKGPLPDHDSMALSGTMRMHGTAYYALRGDPFLLALDETLTIGGTLTEAGHTSPVTIEYRRVIRADNS